MQMMRTLPDGKINQGFVEVPDAGGISRALMEYMQTSEQVVSMLAMGTLLDEGRVVAAGGYLVQLLPEVGRGPLMVMTERLKDFESIDAQLREPGFSPDGAAGRAALRHALHAPGREPGRLRMLVQRAARRVGHLDLAQARHRAPALGR